jgi:hypothetical protein
MKEVLVTTMNGSQHKQNSISSIAMEKSAQSERVLDLGRKLVEELGLVDSNDTLGRWMAHHVADLILKAENATGSDKVTAETEAFDTILALWKHRSEFPSGKRPYEELEPVMRTVASLDPEDDTPRYYRVMRPPKGEAAETSDQEQWLRLAEGLDYLAKVLIGFCLAEAARAALDRSKEWVKIAEEAGDIGPYEITMRFLSRTEESNKRPDPHDEQRKILADRIKRMRSFMGLAESVVETLAKRLEELPAAESSDASEGIVLLASQTLVDPFGDD